ncbi:MAG: hypothetical protein ACYDDU_07940 [Dermatophilaceae bacterium]
MPRTESSPDPASPEAAVGGVATDQLVPADSSTARPRLRITAGAWPLRRLVAAASLFPVLFTLLVGVAGGWAPVAAPAWTALVALVALAAAFTLATYLPRPGAGRTLDLGCTPCAAVAALSVLGAAWVLRTAPHDVSTAVLALVIVMFGLTQRLTSPSTCAAPTPRT